MYRATYNRLPPGDTTTCDLPSALDDFLQGMTFPIGTKGSNAVINFTGAPTVQAGPFGWVYSVDEGAIVINSPERVDWDSSAAFADL